MPPGTGSAIVRVARGGPAVLLVLFIGLLGLVCGAGRRRTIMNLSSQAMEVSRALAGRA
jgi:hypothetical protein